MLMNTLRETFLDELADLYDAEKQLVKALPNMAEAAQDGALKAGFETHLRETEEHVIRLERVFQMFGERAKGKKCKAMKGLIAEGEDLVDDQAGDAALIAAAQKVEHYEIASYGSLRSWAELLGYGEAVSLLEQTMNEEKATDEKLTRIAESAVNVEQKEGERVQAGAE